MVIAKVKKEGRAYGEEIKIFSLEDIERVLCRAAGAAVLSGDEKVEVEFRCNNHQISIVKGYQKIRSRVKSYEFLKKLLTSNF